MYNITVKYCFPRKNVHVWPEIPWVRVDQTPAGEFEVITGLSLTRDALLRLLFYVSPNKWISVQDNDLVTIGGAKKIHRAEQVIESHRGNISAKY